MIPVYCTLHYIVSRDAALDSETAIGTGWVPRSFCPLVTTVNSGKTADSVEMPYRVMDRVGPRNHVLDRGPDSLTGRGKILGEMRLRHVTYGEEMNDIVAWM